MLVIIVHDLFYKTIYLRTYYLYIFFLYKIYTLFIPRNNIEISIDWLIEFPFTFDLKSESLRNIEASTNLRLYAFVLPTTRAQGYNHSIRIKPYNIESMLIL